MTPGPVPPATGPPSAPKDLAGPRRDVPRTEERRSRFVAEAESILEALAQGAGQHPPDLPAGAIDGAASLPHRPRAKPDIPERAGPPAEHREDPFADLTRTQQSYGAAQARQRAAVHPPGSLLDVEI